MTRPRVAVVFGGRSTEHAISCVSAGSVLAAIDRSRYDVVPVGITTEGRWVLVDDDPTALAIANRELPSVDARGTRLTLPADPTGTSLVTLDAADLPAEFGHVDVVFPLLHGPWGEDGTIQGLLEMAGIPYVGSGVLASAVGMDKEYMKVVLGARGLPVGRYAVHRVGRPVNVDLDELGLPVFVKPARGGSSVGISKVERPDELVAALDVAHQHDPKALIEEVTPGREIECGVLDGLSGSAAEASVPGEIRVTGAGHAFYDFEAKYLDDVTELDVPADLSAAVTKNVQDLACAAYDAIGCEGLARVDFFVDGNDVVVNEVNTMPGFTPYSMFPRMWAASGVDYQTLVDRLLQSALRRGTGLR
ncbi:MAG: D-alanine--D-alanine ligase family protein [Actinomycetes bacterium]